MKYILLEIASYLLLGIGIGAIILTFRGRLAFLFGVFTTAGAFLLSTVVGIFFDKLKSGTDVISEQINQAFDLMKESLASISPEQMQQLPGIIRMENLDILKDIYKLMFPSVMILNTVLISYILYMVVKQLLSVFKKDVSMYPKFSELKLRRSASVALGLTYILPYFVWSNTVSAAVSNLMIVIGGVAFVCGLSFVDFRLRSRLKSGWFRLLVYIAVFFVASVAMPLVIFALVITAVADSFFDFRGLLRREVKSDGQ